MDDIIFIGEWIKDRVLGSGSFGTVVLWKHKNSDNKLAIKTCRWSDELTAKHRERWTKEVEMLQSCNHPNIVRTIALPPEFLGGLAPVNPSRLPILCMEYCSGGDLRQQLNKPDASCGLKEVKVRKILSDIGSAMQFLHSNKITHRDLKPENIVMHVPPGMNELTEDKVIYKIIDLGYAKEIDTKSICASFVGTLQYLAPEIFFSTYSNSVDFWSLGLLAFEIICGTRPFLPFKAPVQWMPFVKKKLHDNICIFETFHGDIEYSNEIFPENHISKQFKSLIEDWLRVALEWDPKLRGRNIPSKVTFNLPESKESGSGSKVVIFDMLQSILSKRIIKIFSLSTVSQLAYEIISTTTISELKEWIFKDVNIPVKDQMILSQANCIDIENSDLVIKYWNGNSAIMLFLYDNRNMIDDNTSPIVPKAVQRCLELPKALYNYRNSQTLYRSAFYLLISQMDMYDFLINALFTRGESLKQESKKQLLNHNNVDKKLGKLLAKVETVKKMVELGEKHVEELKCNGTGTNFLGGFTKTFKDAHDFDDKINKLVSAWALLSVRIQSAARRCNEGISNDLNCFVAKYNYQNIFSNAYKTYISHNKDDFYSNNKEREKPCPEIVRVSYDCLKLRSKILQELQNQQFLLKVKDLSIEFSKISDIISKADENTEKLSEDLEHLTEEFTNCVWSTISVVLRDADNMADIPYSVVSYQKRDFRIGEPVSSHCLNGNNDVNEITSLVSESLKLRQNHVVLCEKLNAQKNMLLQNSELDFSFLN